MRSLSNAMTAIVTFAAKKKEFGDLCELTETGLYQPRWISVARKIGGGRVPFDQNFRKFRFKVEWSRKFPEIRFENFGQPLEVVLFSIWNSGNFLLHLAFLPGTNRA